MSNDKQPQQEASNPENATGSPLQQYKTFRDFTLECTACQNEIEPHWQICSHCGTRLETQCPGCGTPLPPAGAAACPHCGLAIPQVED